MLSRQIFNICEIVLGDNSEFDYSFPVTLEDGTIASLYTDEEFKTIIMHQYTSFGLYAAQYWDDTKKEMIYIMNNIYDAREQFHKLYSLWIKDRSSGIGKMLDALRKKYNPIWNVDGVTGTIHQEAHTGTDSDKKTGSDKIHDTLGSGSEIESGSSTTVRSGNETDTPTGKDINTSLNTTFDSATYRDVNKGETTFDQRIDTHTYNSVTDTYNVDPTNPLTKTYNMAGDHNTTYDSSNTKTLNLKDEILDMQIRQGNIGVTSTQSLIQQQLALTELDDIINYTIHDFVHRNLVIIS